MTRRAALLALAERCEIQRPADRLLDAEIQWRVLGRTSGDYTPPHYTSKIDDALMLRPKGAEYQLSTLCGLAQVEMPLNFIDVDPQHGKRLDGNEAMAICAAALRALAAQEEDGK